MKRGRRKGNVVARKTIQMKRLYVPCIECNSLRRFGSPHGKGIFPTLSQCISDPYPSPHFACWLPCRSYLQVKTRSNYLSSILLRSRIWKDTRMHFPRDLIPLREEPPFATRWRELSHWIHYRVLMQHDFIRQKKMTQFICKTTWSDTHTKHRKKVCNSKQNIFAWQD